MESKQHYRFLNPSKVVIFWIIIKDFKFPFQIKIRKIVLIPSVILKRGEDYRVDNDFTLCYNRKGDRI